LAKRKLSQYDDLATFENVIQPNLDELKEDYSLKGKWAKEYFNNDHPIILELGCGKGEYTISLAKHLGRKCKCSKA